MAIQKLFYVKLFVRPDPQSPTRSKKEQYSCPSALNDISSTLKYGQETLKNTVAIFVSNSLLTFTTIAPPQPRYPFLFFLEDIFCLLFSFIDMTWPSHRFTFFRNGQTVKAIGNRKKAKLLNDNCKKYQFLIKTWHKTQPRVVFKRAMLMICLKVEDKEGKTQERLTVEKAELVLKMDKYKYINTNIFSLCHSVTHSE